MFKADRNSLVDRVFDLKVGNAFFSRVRVVGYPFSRNHFLLSYFVFSFDFLHSSLQFITSVTASLSNPSFRSLAQPTCISAHFLVPFLPAVASASFHHFLFLSLFSVTARYDSVAELRQSYRNDKQLKVQVPPLVLLSQESILFSKSAMRRFKEKKPIWQHVKYCCQLI